eukprot:TRINITY_DN5939_c0_g1_i1.p1 TRINITY_DN5939_c0_g1~~TRINITY_DN5939_c0_g1_i1.p1  ORF type:complete len:949 (+),score=353.92 TRINITY_DN5939_c0_g1_i1:344-2848(+)
MQTGMMLYISGDTKSPLSASPADGPLARMPSPVALPAAVPPASQSTAGLQTPAPQSPLPVAPAVAAQRSGPQALEAWQSQIEEAAAKRRAEQILSDFLQTKNELAESELELAKTRRELENTKQLTVELEGKLHVAEQALAEPSPELNALRAEVYQLKKDAAELRRANTQYDKREREAALALESLQLGVEVAEERGRKEAARRLSELEQELREATAFIDALKERLIAQAADIKRLSAPAPDTRHTEHIILPVGALRRIVTVNGGGAQLFREKYNVEVELAENSLTVTGDPFQVRLLREECERILGVGPSSPTASTSAEVDPKELRWRAREEELVAQVEEQRQQLCAATTTVDSLHVALRHAQSRTEEDLAATRELREMQVKKQVQRDAEAAEMCTSIEQLRSELASKSSALDDANSALAAATDALQAELQKVQGRRDEASSLRETVSKLEDEGTEMRHELFLARETVGSLTKTNTELQAALEERDQQVINIPATQAALSEVRAALERSRAEMHLRTAEASEERGRLQEKNMRVQEALDAAVVQLQDTRRLRDELRMSRLREEELEATCRALQLGPDTAKANDQEREIARLREEGRRHLRDTAALNETLADCRRRYEQILGENERLRADALRTMQDSRSRAQQVSHLTTKLEEERTMAALSQEKRSLQAESLGATLAARERELELLKARVMTRADLTSEVESLRSELRAAVSGASAVPARAPTPPSMPGDSLARVDSFTPFASSTRLAGAPHTSPHRDVALPLSPSSAGSRPSASPAAVLTRAQSSLLAARAGAGIAAARARSPPQQKSSPSRGRPNSPSPATAASVRGAAVQQRT